MPALCVSTATVALPVSVIAEADGLSGSQRRLVGGLLGSHVAAGHEAVNLGQDPLEGGVDAGGIEGGRFDEGKVVLLGEGHGLVGLDGAEVSQIGLVAHEHNHNVGLGVVAELLEPALDVLERGVLGDVVNEEGTDGAAVVGRGDGTVALLSGGVPDLGLDRLALGLDGLGGELDADRRLGFEVELVAGEAREEVGLTDTGVANEDDLEKVVVFFVHAGGHFLYYIVRILWSGYGVCRGFGMGGRVRHVAER